jgi:hypothetical protein
MMEIHAPKIYSDRIAHADTFHRIATTVIHAQKIMLMLHAFVTTILFALQALILAQK